MNRVPQHPPEDPNEMQRAQAQVQLIDSLRGHLDLAFAMLRTAHLAAKDGRDTCQPLLATARAALDTIRNLEGRIEDPSLWKDIHTRADNLESAIKSFSN